MKKVSLLILLLISLGASSQNFLPFHSNRPAYYSFAVSYNTALFYTQAGIYIDSMKVIGSDTVFYHYPIIDYDNSVPDCYLKAHDTSFVGDHSIRTANGDDEFFNRHGDTIFFKNNSVLNDSWTLLNLGGGNKIVASVQSVSVESILGVSDSVKKIVLQAKDSLGNSISNIFNNKTFKIGKLFGLINGYSLFHLPFDTIAFSIVGIENPSIGLSSENLTPEKIFDFEAGDRLDYSYGSGVEPTTHNYYEETDWILSKSSSNDGDTISYQVNFLRWSHGNNWFDVYDTVTSGTKQLIYTLSGKDFLKSKPFQIFYSDLSETFYQVLIQSPYDSLLSARKVEPYYFFLDDNSDCLEYTVNDLYTDDIYAAGLALASRAGDEGWIWTYDYLVYFNKAGSEWGDSLNWPHILNVNEISGFALSAISPNPVGDKFFLSGNFSSSQTHFTLVNSLGQEMKLTQLSSQLNSVAFDVHGLPAGIYVLQVKKEDEVTNLKFVKE